MYFTGKKTLCTFLHHGNLQHYGRRSLIGYSPWGRQESDVTERLHFHFSIEGLEERSCPLADVWCSTPTACTLLRLNFELKVPDQEAVQMGAYWLHSGQEHPFSLRGLFSGNIKHTQTQLGRWRESLVNFEMLKILRTNSCMVALKWNTFTWVFMLTHAHPSSWLWGWIRNIEIKGLLWWSQELRIASQSRRQVRFLIRKLRFQMLQDNQAFMPQLQKPAWLNKRPSPAPLLPKKEILNN